MANASAKKTAAQNETYLRALHYQTLAVYLVVVVLRLLFRRTSVSGLVLASSSAALSFALSRFLNRIGTPRRDSRGELVSSGEDLNASGLTEYAWDVIYVTFACQIGSALLGERFWYLYLAIPIFAVYKFWGFVAPMFGSLGSVLGTRAPAIPAEEDANAAATPTSKRQEKLKKRLERGDPRVKQVQKKTYQ